MGAFNSFTWRISSGRSRKRQVVMSTAALFSFGCVIFFVVMTGVFMYGLAAVKQIADRDK
jgi:hypothetical protein